MEKPLTALLFMMLLMLSGMFLTVILSVMALSFVSGIGINEVVELINSNNLEGHPAWLKFLQTAQTIGLFILPGIILFTLLQKSGQRKYRFNYEQVTRIAVLVGITLLISFPFMNVCIEWNSQMKLPARFHDLEEAMISMEEQAGRLTEIMLQGKNIGDLLVNLMMIAVLPAIGEELIFRGVLQRILQMWFRKSWLPVLLAAFFFSAVHFQFYGFLPRFLLGIYFGFLFAITGKIWVPALAHFLNNASAVLITFFIDEIPGKNTAENLSLTTTLISLVLTLSLVYYFRTEVLKMREIRTESL